MRLGKWIWIGLVIVMLVCITGFLFRETVNSPVNENAEINSFSYSHSGSSTREIYTYHVDMEEERSEWKVQYDLNCGNETYTLPVDEELVQELAELVKGHDLYKWDGFRKTNPHILDGSGFHLEIRFDDGTAITASGSNRFPDGYGEAAAEIDDLFLNYLKRQGIEEEGGY